MGKIRKSRLSWKPSESSRVVGYRLYWSKETPVSYNSKFIKVGNTTEVNLPDILLGIESSEELIFLGISAVDKMGNESDMVFLPDPYYLSLPPAPDDLVLTPLDDFKVTVLKTKAENPAQYMETPATQETDQISRQDPPGPPLKHVTTEGRIVDDFGFRIRKALGD